MTTRDPIEVALSTLEQCHENGYDHLVSAYLPQLVALIRCQAIEIAARRSKDTPTPWTIFITTGEATNKARAALADAVGGNT